MQTITKEGYKFYFLDANNVFPFDKDENSKLPIHHAPMRAVDVIGEFDPYDIFLEIKKYRAGDPFTKDNINYRMETLKYQFRDTFLYRYAEKKILKPIKYFIFTDLESPENRAFFKNFKENLPVGIPKNAIDTWQCALAIECHIVNMNSWNKISPGNWWVEKIK